MSTLEKLKACQTRSDLSKLLGFVPKGLAFALYKIPDDAKYREFSIPKKGGGQRKICAPNPRLGLVQRRLATRLYECVLEIEEKQPNRRRVTHGFQKGRSIITNADRHHSRRYVFNIDIQDFFQSINFGRVRGFFQKDSTFALNDEVATTIAQIACWQNGLPQGSPCSPVIANLVGHILDVKLLKLAKQARHIFLDERTKLSFVDRCTGRWEAGRMGAFREPSKRHQAGRLCHQSRKDAYANTWFASDGHWTHGQ